jgi:hypothetical protein
MTGGHLSAARLKGGHTSYVLHTLFMIGMDVACGFEGPGLFVLDLSMKSAIASYRA